jgi:cytochrome c553
LIAFRDHIRGVAILTLVARLLLALAVVATALSAWAGAEDGPPEWAYPLNRGGRPTPPPDDGALRHVPGSSVALPQAALFNRFAAPDWHPDGHPAMPEPVAFGRKPDVWACGFCHYPNGQGRPENAPLAGLPAAYIVRQVAAIRNGLRRSAQPAMLAPGLMVANSQHATPDDVATAAAYFAALPYTSWIRVVETDTVPRTQVVGVSALAAIKGGGSEPLGDRIIEVPENDALTALRDDASGFVAYVPPGSLRRGEVLAHATEGTRLACTTCHGAALRGTDVAPPLAGRSPSYLFRQLYDMRLGSRTGPSVAQMQPEVATLTDGAMRDLVAYLASLTP